MCSYPFNEHETAHFGHKVFFVLLNRSLQADYNGTKNIFKAQQDVIFKLNLMTQLNSEGKYRSCIEVKISKKQLL